MNGFADQSVGRAAVFTGIVTVDGNGHFITRENQFLNAKTAALLEFARADAEDARGRRRRRRAHRGRLRDYSGMDLLLYTVGAGPRAHGSGPAPSPAPRALSPS